MYHQSLPTAHGYNYNSIADPYWIERIDNISYLQPVNMLYAFANPT